MLTNSCLFGWSFGQGDLDMFACSENRLYRNDGDGKFVSVVGAGDYGSSAYQDFYDREENDATNWDGNFKFRSRIESLGIGCADLELADVNADGWLDVFVMNRHSSEEYYYQDRIRNEMYLSNGDGTFSAQLDNNFTAWQSRGRRREAKELFMVDIDSDGDIDIHYVSIVDSCADSECVGNGLYTQQIIYINDGAGNFEMTRNCEGWNMPWSGLSSTGFVFLQQDIDDDGGHCSRV